MKKLKPLLFLCILSLLAACKKDNSNIITPQKPDPLESATDSGAYTVNGKTYSIFSLSYISVGNTDASLRIDSVVDHVNYISGNKDSVFFSRTYGVTNPHGEAYMEISFFKKYSKAEMTKNSFNTYIPNNQLDLFKIGKYDFQVDYTRANAHNGVAVNLFKNGTSFSTRTLPEATTIKQVSQNESHFEITNFKALKNGDYLLEAKFDAVVFDGEEHPHKVTNGYLRVSIP